MKKYKVIFHIDLNAFFASCEMAENKELKNVPLGIGPSNERGILTTANYEARKYGVKSAMPLSEAKRLCSSLKVLPTNFPLYQKYSSYFFEYLKRYTSTLEPASIDEGYLDMTDALEDRHPYDVAKTMQTELSEQYDLPVSIGIAPNKFLAKMASDMHKPMGITILRKRDVKDKLWPLPIEELHGIGKKTVPNLKLMGIETIGDLAEFKDMRKLRNFLGNQAEAFINKVHGEDKSEVDPSRQESHQSIGNSKTYEGFLHEYQEMINALKKLTERVVERLKDHSLAAKSIAVQLRDDDYTNHSKHFSFQYHTDHFYEIFEVVEHVFEDLFDNKPVHLLGVSASNLEEKSTLFKQLSIFESKDKLSRDEHVNNVLKSINKHYDKPLLNKGIKQNR